MVSFVNFNLVNLLGVIVGDITNINCLTISGGGQVFGNVTVEKLIITENGSIKGNLICKTVKLGFQASIIGNVFIHSSANTSIDSERTPDQLNCNTNSNTNSNKSNSKDGNIISNSENKNIFRDGYHEIKNSPKNLLKSSRKVPEECDSSLNHARAYASANSCGFS